MFESGQPIRDARVYICQSHELNSLPILLESYDILESDHGYIIMKVH